MVLSMTGFGRAENVLNGRDITVEIKSVNSRYFEYSSRMPRSYNFVDDKLKKLLSTSISRGKVELSMTVQSVAAADEKIGVNMTLAKQYQVAFDLISEQLGVTNDVTAGTIARMPDVFTVQKSEQDEQQLWSDIESVAKKAVESFVAMRAVEGERMKADILSRLIFIENAVAKVEENSQDRVSAYTNRLFERLKTVLEDKSIDETRILTEAAIFADKTAVDEETVRLKSHIKQYRDILEKSEPVGRKLDFLTQELNRETNTIGSKCSDIEITRLVVDMKAEIEKIREQIQNIE